MELHFQKKRHITKDEEEVAETLYALAGMFTNADKADQQKVDDEQPEIKSSATLEEGISINVSSSTYFCWSVYALVKCLIILNASLSRYLSDTTRRD